MTPKVNSFVYIFPAILIICIVLYVIYNAVNKFGLEIKTEIATVTDKTQAEGSTSYVNNIAANRSWVQSSKQGDYFIISINIGNEPTIALVTKDRFESLKKNDQIQVKTRRTRLTKRLEVIEVK